MRPSTLAPLALAFLSLACSAASGPADGAVADAEVPDASLRDGGTCEGEYLVFDYVFDGVPGSTGCVPATGYTGRTVEGDYLVSQFLYGPELIRAENRWELMRLPSEILCGASLELRSTPLVTGASGQCESLVAGAWSATPEVGVILGYNTTPDGQPCREGPTLIEHAVTTGGTWHVIQGGDPGDWVDVETRDVTFEPILGHTFRFDRMRWHVQLWPPRSFGCGGRTRCDSTTQYCEQAVSGVVGEPDSYRCVAYPEGCASCECLPGDSCWGASETGIHVSIGG